MSLYASDTSVSTDRSKAEIERLVQRYGAESFGTGWDVEHCRALIAFRAHGKNIQFMLEIPKPEDFATSPAGRSRNTSAMQAHCEQEHRRRWRSLGLLIKAKLDAVASGITVFEEEFLAHIVVPGSKGKTVGQLMLPQLEASFKSGKLPPLLPGLGETSAAGSGA